MLADMPVNPLMSLNSAVTSVSIAWTVRLGFSISCAIVVGGLGQIKGTVIAAFALGFLNSFIEYNTTASLAKVIVFVIIVIFLQVRPQGLFTVRTRSLA